MDRKKILIGVCCIRHNDAFFLSVYNLLKKMNEKYRVSVLIEKDQELPEAQQKIASHFMLGDFDYLLWLEDDHYGHTIEMVEALLKGDSDIVSMKYYIRGYPYPCVHNIRTDDYYSQDIDGGYMEVDLTGFGMTLMKRSVFERLPIPWFVGERDAWNRAVTDLSFCRRVKMVGLKILGCFDYCLPHDGITQENVQELRDQNAPTYVDRYLAMMKNKREN